MKTNAIWSVALILLVASSIDARAATTRYVWQSSPSPAPPYTTWATAARTIQAAVDAAVAGDEIVVTNGTYATGGRAVGSSWYGPNLLINRVAVTKAVSLRSVNGPQFTALQGYQVPGTTNGDGAARCAYLAAGASLSGFTLTNGATRRGGDNDWRELNGGGVWCESTNALVTNCVLIGNSAYYFGGGAFGGLFIHCTFTNNKAEIRSGGGASGYAIKDGGLPEDDIRCILKYCTLIGNSARADGGGAADDSGTQAGCTLDNCTVIGNRAGGIGGGVYNGTLNNCLVTGNSAWAVGGAGGRLNNCTVTGNSASREVGGAGGTLNNCIVYYNTAPRDANYAYGELKFTHCCTTPLPRGSGNIAVEPQLANAFRLSPNSPCLGAGSYAYVTGEDLDGEPWANPPAMGCDQYYSGSLTGALTVAISASHTTVVTGFSVSLQASISGQVSNSRWEFGDGTVVSNRPAVEHSWSAAGDYPVVLRAYNRDNPGGAVATLTVHVAQQPVHYVALGNTAAVALYNSWATAANTIQAAVDAATVTGALVLVSNGVYQTGGRVVGTDLLLNRVVVNKPVIVRSVNGPQFTVIQGYQVPFTINGNGAIRCVRLSTGASLSGFTLTNGATRSSGFYQELAGGGVWSDSSATVSDCVIAGNSAFSNGGGAFGGTLTNCSLRNNRTTDGQSGDGGGAYYCTLTGCMLTGNVTVGDGGAAAESRLINCALVGNSTTWRGGGAAFSVLINCTLSGNAAGPATFNLCSGGGASQSTLFNCILTNNWASGDGGGAYGSTDRDFRHVLYDCTIISNRCERDGGGACLSALNNCTLTGNSAGRRGGGAYRSILNQCTVVKNSAAVSGGGVVGEPRDPNCQDCVENPCILSNCIVYYNTAPTAANYDRTNIFNFTCTTPLPVGGMGNITGAPLFVDYDGGNLRLQSNSPCINIGDNASIVSSTDLDGRPRVVGGTVDMGAYEFQGVEMAGFMAWLQQYGLAVDGSADYTDTDWDGHNNWQEWRCQTIPTDATSILKLEPPATTTSGLVARWSSVAGRFYSLERATGLAPPFGFTALQGNISGQAGTTSFTDTNAVGPGPFFYRVRVEP